MTGYAASAQVTAPTGTSDFPRFVSDLSDTSADLREQSEHLRSKDFETQAQLAETRDELRRLNEELTAASRRDSNVPMEDATLRSRIADELGLAADALPYAAELLAVDPAAAEWEAAAERLTRPFAMSMLVPEEHYRRIVSWVDANHLGRRLTYYRVPAGVAGGAGTPAAGTMAFLLQVRGGHPVSGWLRAEVNRRYQHTCVDHVAELGRHPRAVTRAGQIKDGERHQKDDRRHARDRRFYVLGWDTAARRAALRAALPPLEATYKRLGKAAEQLGEQRTALGEREFAIRMLRDRYTDATAVDVPGAVRALDEANRHYEALASSPKLAELLAKQAACEKGITDLREKLSEVDQAVGGAKSRLASYEGSLERSTLALTAMESAELSPESGDALADALREAGDAPEEVERCDAWRRNFREQLETNAIHELVAFSHLLERQAQGITERIDTINGALAEIDYRLGTYIRLEAERSPDPIVREFRGQLREITSNALLGDDDAVRSLDAVRFGVLITNRGFESARYHPRE